MRTLRFIGFGVAVIGLAVACSSDAELCTEEGASLPCDANRLDDDGVTPMSCVPSELSGAVPDRCGVFVSSSLGSPSAGATVALGSRDNPFINLADAVAGLGDAKAIYLCSESIAAGVEVPAGVSLYGGLDCNRGWTHRSDVKSTLKGSANAPAIVVYGIGSSSVQDVALQAATATEPGASSIAALVEAATVDFVRCELNAADGMAGADGEQAQPAPSRAEAGNDGGDACSSMPLVQPGPAKFNPACSGSIGGSGGVGVMNGSAGNGDIGQPNSVAGGLGEGQEGAEDYCQRGSDGADGLMGFAAQSVSGIGTIDGEGYRAPGPVDGAEGQAAHGGGGGGGSKGTVFECGGAGPGASGGSGGPGGCGGLGGRGGLGGGSSIALMSINATVTLTNSALLSARGGAGGAGLDGQVGQKGGLGGKGGEDELAPSTKPACDGGKGGDGGRGGPGAGGLGGHSLAIAYVGEEPASDGGSVSVGKAGVGGPSKGHPGAAGVAAETLQFPSSGP